MYLTEDLQKQLTGLQEFAQSPQEEYQKSLDAIQRALQIKQAGGYVKGTSARRQLEAAFESVPGPYAFELYNQLISGNGRREKVFRHKPHYATQRAMLTILVRKAKEFSEQEKEELRRKERAASLQACALRKGLDSLNTWARGLTDDSFKNVSPAAMIAQALLQAKRTILLGQKNCP